MRWRIVLLASAALFFARYASAGDVTLAWDPCTSPVLAGYQLHYGKASGQYGTVVDVGNVTTWTVLNLAAGTYYFAVKAYGIAGEQSGFSNEVKAVLSDDLAPIANNITVLASPRFSAGQNVLGIDTMVGLALANLSVDSAMLTFTAGRGQNCGHAGEGENIY